MSKATGDERAREQLINIHGHLVRKTRQRILPVVPFRVEADDLMSEGFIALTLAVDRFDATREVQFPSFAISMIRGRMLELLRREDWMTRHGRNCEKRFLAATEALIASLGRRPTDAELAAELGIDIDSLEKLRPEHFGVTVESYDRWTVEGGAADWTETVADPAPSPEAQALADRDSASLIENVLLACLKLSPSDRHLLYLLYWRGLSWAEVGAALGIAKETVAYRQRRVFAELKARLAL